MNAIEVKRYVVFVLLAIITVNLCFDDFQDPLLCLGFKIHITSFLLKLKQFRFSHEMRLLTLENVLFLGFGNNFLKAFTCEELVVVGESEQLEIRLNDTIDTNPVPIHEAAAFKGLIQLLKIAPTANAA